MATPLTLPAKATPYKIIISAKDPQKGRVQVWKPAGEFCFKTVGLRLHG